MLNENEFIDWCQSIRISKQTKDFISNIRNSPPSRSVRSAKSSVSGRFPSRKMGVTIQFESHKNELPYIYELEHDPNVLEYYDQPPAIRLNYKNSVTGRGLGHLHTPDFFVIRKDHAGWVECKTEDALLKLAVKQSNRFQIDEGGNWCCPPGKEFAAQYDLNYIIRSNKEINWTYQRNIEFLDDYYRSDELSVSGEICSVVTEIVNKNPAITLEYLIEKTKEKAALDDIFLLIAFDKLYIDLCASLLAEPKNTRVFVSKEVSLAYENIYRLNFLSEDYNRQINVIDIVPGTEIQWDGKVWKIINVGEKLIFLADENESVSEIPQNIFEKLVLEGKVSGLPQINENQISIQIRELFSQTSEDDFAEANRRLPYVLDKINGNLLDDENAVSDRTVRRWLASYNKAKEFFGYGFIGLIPKISSGNRTQRFGIETISLLEEKIEKEYETVIQRNRTAVYNSLCQECAREGLMIPSYSTFCSYVKKREIFNSLSKRQGNRASYQRSPFYWEISLTTPRHGDRPFHIAHIDHTELDIELIDSETKQNLGRPWLTLMIDAYSRRILSVYLCFDPPSYRSCMMALRDCVRRFGRFPQILVTDGGKDFLSIYFESLLGIYECTKKIRPPAEARFGSLIERLFGTTNSRFIHNLTGNTKIMKNVRLVTKSVNPKNHAIWDLKSLFDHICYYAYEVYDEIEHPTLNQTPKETFLRALQLSGKRTNRLIPYDEIFKMLTLPTTQRGDAKITAEKGIKIRNIYYWCDDFRHPEIIGTRVKLRYDPFDTGKVYVFINKVWRECISEHYKTFRGRSEKEIYTASEELRKKKKFNGEKSRITGARLAKFLESAEGTELLLKQQIKDREQRYVWETINGNTAFVGDLSSPDKTDMLESSYSDNENSSVENYSEISATKEENSKFIVFKRL